MNKLWAAILVVAVIAAIGSAALTGFFSAKPGELDEFAQCLAENGVILYGTEGCPICQAQRAVFGESIKYLNYVSCDSNPGKCVDDGVTRVPTWVIDGEKHTKKFSVEELAELTGCAL